MTEDRVARKALGTHFPFSGSLCNTLIGRTTETGHAVAGVNNGSGFGCLGLHVASISGHDPVFPVR